MLETARAIEIPVIQGTTLPTIEEVVALAKKIPFSKNRNNNKNGP
jgi:hypothetical protein